MCVIDELWGRLYLIGNLPPFFPWGPFSLPPAPGELSGRSRSYLFAICPPKLLGTYRTVVSPRLVLHLKLIQVSKSGWKAQKEAVENYIYYIGSQMFQNSDLFRDSKSHVQKLTFLDFFSDHWSSGSVEAARSVFGLFVIVSDREVDVWREALLGLFCWCCMALLSLLI